MTPLELSLLVQGTPEWKQARAGLLTGSRTADMIAMTQKGQEKAERAHYRYEIIVERLTGEPYPQTAEYARQVQWGKEQEPFARAAYEMQQDVLVETCGLIMHPEISCFAASPDGFVGDDGLLQIKCPTTKTHLGYILAGVIPIEHCPQMLAEMACTGRKWCDFVSFDPRLPPHLQLFIRRFDRDEALIAAVEREVVQFNQQVEETLKALPQKPQAIAEVLDWPTADEVQF